MDCTHPPVITVVTRISEFWLLVDRRDPDGCWPWTGYVNEDGYGEFFWEGRMIGAHELAITFTTGERRLPHLDTCHRCGTRPCCNPAHVRFDTRRGNVADTIAMGRQNWQARRLTDDEIVLLRERRAAGASHAVLARDFGVTESMSSMITTGRKFPEVGGPIQTKYWRAA